MSEKSPLTITFDLPCSGCGYNVRGLPLKSACPKCGAAVAASLPWDRDSMLDPAAVQLQAGLGLLELQCDKCGSLFRASGVPGPCSCGAHSDDAVRAVIARRAGTRVSWLWRVRCAEWISSLMALTLAVLVFKQAGAMTSSGILGHVPLFAIALWMLALFVFSMAFEPRREIWRYHGLERRFVRARLLLLALLVLFVLNPMCLCGALYCDTRP